MDELNSLLDQNALNLERARRHVANLAHGLKTPLATLALAFDEPGADPGRRLGPLVAGMDRLIRHHLARARAAARRYRAAFWRAAARIRARGCRWRPSPAVWRRRT